MAKNAVGENIKRIRGQMSITQEELALRCDLTQSFINFLESGKRGYSKTSIEKIAKALGVHVSDLFLEREDRNAIRVSEQFQSYGKRRKQYYEEMILLFDKLPDPIVDHYRMLLNAEVSIRSKSKD